MRTYRTPLAAGALAVAAAAGVITGATLAPGGGSCTDPATHAVVVNGDGIRNDGASFVCASGALVSYSTPRQLPPGFWWRTVTGHVGDCGPRALPRKHPGVFVGYGPGDMQSVLFCPPRPWGNGTVNPS